MSSLAKKHNAINLGQGFPNYDCPEALKQLITKHLNDGKNQYAPMPGVIELREKLAIKMNAAYGCQLSGETNITITAGATQAIFTVISAFVHPGDEVIVIEPAYDSYRPSIELTGGIVIPYILQGPEYKINWEAFALLISDRTRMIIINTPQNPIGKTLKKQDLTMLQELTSNSNIMILSDEVYEHLIYDEQPHQSVWRFPGLHERSLSVYSFGKTFHSTGWKIGYCVSSEYLMSEFRKVHQWNVFSVNSFIQYALADFLEEPNHYLQLSDFYQKKRDYFQDAIKGCSLIPLNSEGTYFQLYDYSQVSDLPDTEFAKKLTIDHGVATIPVSAFNSGQSNDKLIRLCFAKTEELLDQAADRLRIL